MHRTQNNSLKQILKLIFKIRLSLGHIVATVTIYINNCDSPNKPLAQSILILFIHFFSQPFSHLLHKKFCEGVGIQSIMGVPFSFPNLVNLNSIPPKDTVHSNLFNFFPLILLPYFSLNLSISITQNSLKITGIKYFQGILFTCLLTCFYSIHRSPY